MKQQRSGWTSKLAFLTLGFLMSCQIIFSPDGGKLSDSDGDGGQGGGGGQPGCVDVAVDCPATGSECVVATCTDGVCGTTRLDEGTPTTTQTAGDCQVIQCDAAGEVVSVSDDTDVGDDGNGCTDNLCDNGATSFPNKADGTPCVGGNVCVSGMCVSSPDCVDNVMDGDETDIDCGGGCVPCGDGLDCAVDADCQSGVCTGNICQGPACDDTVFNGNETDVDCGGPCPPCAYGDNCQSDEDCVPGICVLAHCANCQAGTTSPCYTGPAGTEGVGPCLAGISSCDAQGFGYGPCVGEVVPSPEDCETPEDESCTPDCGEVLWAKAFAGSGTSPQIYSMAVDGSGDIIIAIHPDGSDFGGGPLSAQFALVKLDLAGNLKWSREFSFYGTFSATLSSSSNDIFLFGRTSSPVDFGGGQLNGTSNTSIFVAKLDTSGTHLWSKVFDVQVGSATPAATGATVDKQGSVILHGHFDGSVNFGGATLSSGSAQDAFLVKFSSLGAYQWSHQFSAGGTYPGEVIATANDDIICAGDFFGQGSFGGLALDGTPGGAPGSMYLVKFSAAGSPLWGRTSTGTIASGFSAIPHLYALQAVTGDDVLAAGYGTAAGGVPGTVDVGCGPAPLGPMVANFAGATGTCNWVSPHGTLDVTSDGLGQAFVQGLTAAGDEIALVGADGQEKWAHPSAPGEYIDVVAFAGQIPAHLFAGRFGGTVDIGSGTKITSVFGDDLFLAAAAP